MGDSLEREKERESQRECTESFTSRSQEVGVGFMRIGEGCGGTCKEGSCCFRPYMRAGKAYSLHILLYFGSRIARRYRAKWGFSMVGYWHVGAPKHPARSVAISCIHVYLLLSIPNMATPSLRPDHRWKAKSNPKITKQTKRKLAMGINVIAPLLHVNKDIYAQG